MAKSKKEPGDLASDAIRALKDRGIRQERFAIDNDLDRDAFRSQLRRKVYSKIVLEALARLLNYGDYRALCDDYRIGEENITRSDAAGSISSFEAARRKIERHIHFDPLDVEEFIEKLYTSLGEKSLAVIFSLTETPLECNEERGVKIREAMKQALQRGATFLYIRPTNETYKKLRKWIPDNSESRSPREEYNWLLSEFNLTGVTDDQRSVLLRQPDWCPFWFAGTRVGFYSRENRRGYWDTYLFARFPSDGDTNADRISQDDHHDRNPLLFVGRRTIKMCRSYLRDFFEDEKLRRLVSLLPKED